MKRFNRAWVVYRKELVETLRDKRTLAAMILVPIVLYPVLMIIIVEALRAETGRRRAERYSICVPDERHQEWLRGVLEREDEERAARDAAHRKVIGDDAAQPGDESAGLAAPLRSEQVDLVVIPSGESLWDAVERQDCHAGLIIEPPPATADFADDVNRVAQVIRSDTSARSEFVAGQLVRLLGNEAERVIRARVARTTMGTRGLTPLASVALSTSSPERQFARILAMVVPFLLVIMTVTGALYPAIDLTAGERERGTLETLAVSPVPVGQIVAGKFGVVVTIAMFSTALNLASMTAMFHFSKVAQLAVNVQPAPTLDEWNVERTIEQSASARPASNSPTQRDYLERRRALEREAASRAGLFTTAAPIVLLAMLPFAVLAGGVMLATCSFARTFKEAQNYMMPVMMAFMIPAMVVSYMPTTRLEGLMLVVPVANIVVLIRDLLLGNYQPAAMSICLLSTCFYAAVSIAVAARLYASESVLFADVGSYKTLLYRRFMKPGDAPSPAAALALVALLFPCYFYWQSYLLDFSMSPGRLHLVIAVGQVVVLAAPALLVAWYLKLSRAGTFFLRAPSAAALVASLLIAASIVPVGNFLRSVQYHFFPPGAELMGEEAGKLVSGSLAGLLVALAFVPAVCEELVFRGFLLSALRGRVSTLAAVAVVGAVFGLFHLYMEKIPVHALLGAVLAWMTLRSGSILPAMVVHFANNALPLAATRIEKLANLLGLPESEADLLTPDVDGRLVISFGLLLAGLWLVGRRNRG